MNCVIKCEFSQWYFCAAASAQWGWYHPDIGRARIYTKRRYALKTIRDAGHHVIYPGNRILTVVPVQVIELKPEDIPCPDDCGNRVSNGEAYNCPVCPRVWHADFN